MLWLALYGVGGVATAAVILMVVPGIKSLRSENDAVADGLFASVCGLFWPVVWALALLYVLARVLLWWAKRGMGRKA